MTSLAQKMKEEKHLGSLLGFIVRGVFKNTGQVIAVYFFFIAAYFNKQENVK